MTARVDARRREISRLRRQIAYYCGVIARTESADFRSFPLSETIIEASSEMGPADTYYLNARTTIPGAPGYIQASGTRMCGSLATAWLPQKVMPRNAGTAPFRAFGTISSSRTAFAAMPK